MNRLSIAGIALALCTPVLAQGSLTTPPGGLTSEGPDFAYVFGWFASGRFQQVDGMQKGGPSSAITQIAFRLDNRNHTPERAMGRTWTSITLDISETTNYANMSQVWAQNITTTPARVFDSKWSWPTQQGLPLLKPDAWGGAGGQLRFPFRKPWVYTGKNEILMDYVFRGGTLANNGEWSGSTTAYFFLDSEDLSDHKQGIFELIPPIPVQCADSAFTHSHQRAYTLGFAFAHGPNSSTTWLRNKLQVNYYSSYTAPNWAPVIHALGLGGFPNGVNVGARCNLLYVDFTRPAALFQVSTVDSQGFSDLQGWAVPWDNAFANLHMVIQGAWRDSKTKVLGLTGAAHVTLPAGLPRGIVPIYKTAYSSAPDGGSSDNTPYTSGFYFPYTQYKIQ